ncbi:hypothetical protein SBOR_9563 [Sclerotinia borealis F-4128]|uniref:Uncharacterized protein n=1 Tax=Sclerotinia borealis (strain F-4128) TaxID=1432307 RepID=W9C556_SCLBF|nr:hypothetical protein SBOR_9563 [Sclerotinia borealis F-4128]
MVNNHLSYLSQPLPHPILILIKLTIIPPQQPPKKSTTTLPPPLDPPDLTLLFKHTTHTILLLVPPTQTFTQILTQLLTILRERYPDGLTPMPSLPSTTTTTSTLTNHPTLSTTTLNSTTTTLFDTKIPLPTGTQDIALALPIDAYEPRNGWTELQVGLGDTPESLGLVEGGRVAFRFLSDGGEDGEEEERGFEVKWPSYEEMYGDDAEERTLGGDGDGDGEGREGKDEDEDEDEDEGEGKDRGEGEDEEEDLF